MKNKTLRTQFVEIISKYYWLIFFVCIILFFLSCMFTYFVQDDFYYFKLIYGKTIIDFFTFFIPLRDVVWYRPLSAQIFFFVMKGIFGLRPFFYHLIVFITHAATMIILYKLMLYTFRKRTVSAFSAIFYGIHQIHTVSLAWLATYSFILSPLLICTALYFYVRRRFIITYIFFVLALLASEVALVFPIVILFYQLLTKRKQFKILIPYLGIVILFVILRFLVFSTQVQTHLYQISFTNNLFPLLRFYLLRLTGIPMSIDAMPTYLKIIVLTITGILLMAGSVGLWQFFKSEHKPRVLYLFLFLGSFSLVPFLLLPNHIAPHYLSFTLLGVAPLVGVMMTHFIGKISKYYQRPMMFFLVSMYVLLHFIGSQWTYRTHWIFRRAQLAQQLIQTKQFTHPVGTEEYFSLGADVIYYFR